MAEISEYSNKKMKELEQLQIAPFIVVTLYTHKHTNARKHARTRMQIYTQTHTHTHTHRSKPRKVGPLSKTRKLRPHIHSHSP